jgi:hypothetical protein
VSELSLTTQSTSQTPTIPSKAAKNFDFQQRLKQYTIAALGVAGVSTAAMAQAPATRHIIYTPADIQFDTETLRFNTIGIAFAHNGSYQMFLVENHFTDFFSGGLGFDGYGKLAASAYGAIASHALPKGEIIDKAGTFKAGSQMMAYATYGSYEGAKHSHDQGAFTNVKNKYLGVRIQINGQMHEGWVRLTVSSSKQVITGTITGYAYDTVANETGLAAGQIGGEVGASVKAEDRVFVDDGKAGTLGALASGSAASSRSSH